MLVIVKRHHIANGERQSTTCCPIAQALHEMFGITVYVTRETAKVINRETNRPVRLNLPPVARTFIDNFDDGKKVKPFKFEL